jgi:very-short-patch-repair endonuclease
MEAGCTNSLHLREETTITTIRIAKGKRNTMTETEAVLAGDLLKIGIDYQLQAKIDNSTVDELIQNYFHPAKIIVEESYHDTPEQRQKDLDRMVSHSEKGYDTIQVSNEEVEDNLPVVITKVLGYGAYLRSIHEDATLLEIEKDFTLLPYDNIFLWENTVN